MLAVAEGVMNDIIKDRLREEIKHSKLSTVEIAALVGISSEMVTQYCTTKKLPSLETFAALCKVLDVSADYMLGLKDY